MSGKAESLGMVQSVPGELDISTEPPLVGEDRKSQP